VAIVSPAEAWIDLVIKRSADLRGAGVLSIAFDGSSAVLAPAERKIEDSDEEPATDDVESVNPWESAASYPTGNVPSYGDVEPADKLPAIPQWDD
jgi:hypothetical protein